MAFITKSQINQRFRFRMTSVLLGRSVLWDWRIVFRSPLGVRRRPSLTFCIVIFSSETTGPIWTNLDGMVLGWFPFRIISNDPARQRNKWLIKCNGKSVEHVKGYISLN